MSGGVSVDMGGPSQVDLDFRAIYEGGQNFLARAQALADLKTQQEVSYANLRVGQDARAALDDAQRKQTEAASKLDEANTVLEQAKQTADHVAQKAKEDAFLLVSRAKEEADAVAAAAAKAKADADAYATDKRKAADKSLKNAQALEEESKAANEQAKGSLKEAQDAKAAYLDAQARANESRLNHQRSIDHIAELLDEAIQKMNAMPS